MTSIASKPVTGKQPDSNVTEHEARAVAEAAREKEWTAPSFVRGLFEGKLYLNLIHPFPTVPQEEQERAKPFLDKLAAFMRENVDADEIERNSKIPQRVLDGLAELGAFGIKIPTEYGGLGLSQASYNKAIALVSSWESSIGVMLSAHQSIGVPQVSVAGSRGSSAMPGSMASP